MLYVPCVISSVSSDGVSDVSRVESTLERWLVIDKNLVVNLFYIYTIINEIFKVGVKKIFKNVF
jgi:hypothetical protein